MEPKDFHPSVYIGTRKSGKTRELLLRAHVNRIPILAHNNIWKKNLEGRAKRMGLYNVKVITLNELQRSKVDKVIIDEAQLMLQRLLGVNIESMSTTSYDIVELEEIQEPVADNSAAFYFGAKDGERG